MEFLSDIDIEIALQEAALIYKPMTLLFVDIQQ